MREWFFVSNLKSALAAHAAAQPVIRERIAARLNANRIIRASGKKQPLIILLRNPATNPPDMELKKCTTHP